MKFREIANEISKIVKIQDLKHNMDLNRSTIVSEKDLNRLEKYKKELEILESKL